MQVKLLTPEVFAIATGAPEWTNALYYHDTIIIPVRSADQGNQEDFIRSVRHEFSHAIINAFSNGNCPGWLDEGLAQYMEGNTLDVIRLTLTRWISKNPTIPFHMLQSGFTKLDKKYVAPAYAQSLWAAKLLIERRGYLPIRYFMTLLKNKENDAFHTAFGITESEFETQLACVLSKPACIDTPQQCSKTCNTSTQSASTENARLPF